MEKDINNNNENIKEVFPSARRWGLFAMWFAAISMIGGMAFLMAVEISKNKLKLRHKELLETIDFDYEWNRYKKILKNLDGVPELVKANPKLQQYKAVSLIQTGRLKEALAFLDNLQLKHPKALDIIILRAIALDKAGEHAKALEVFPRKAHITIRATTKISPGMYMLLAPYLYEQFTTNLRAKQPNHSLPATPKPKWLVWKYTDAKSYACAILLTHLKQYDHAHWNLSHLLARNGKNYLALNDLAWLMLTADDNHHHNATQALVYAKRAAELTNYKNDAVLDTLAEAYFQNGNIEKAVKYERIAVKLYGKNREFNLKQLRKFEKALGKKRPQSRPSSKSAKKAI